MRTHGTFADVYRAARHLLLIDDSGMPHDPVVRLDNCGAWMLESALEPASDCVMEVSLEQFHTFWYDMLSDADYVPTAEDEEEFQEVFAVDG